MYNFSQGNSVEIWFRAVTKELQMLDPQPPSLEKIQTVLLKYLNRKTHKALRYLNDVLDPHEWLDLALKVDTLLCLENQHGQLVRVGVDVTSNPEQVDYKLNLIQSKPFFPARKELNIQQHWVVLVDFQRLPELDTIVDMFYDQVDRDMATAIVKL